MPEETEFPETVLEVRDDLQCVVYMDGTGPVVLHDDLDCADLADLVPNTQIGRRLMVARLRYWADEVEKTGKSS